MKRKYEIKLQFDKKYIEIIFHVAYNVCEERETSNGISKERGGKSCRENH
ncbi:MAG: hypothetical protein AB9921_03700 [Erysipelotrichaceae bacterium]